MTGPYMPRSAADDNVPAVPVPQPPLEPGVPAIPDVPDIPQVSTRLSWRDFWGTVRARLGFFRNTYAVTPGLYAVGTPDDASPVLATANYKLSFDALRRELTGRHLWLLVLDTRGINVWCAAGKDLFSTRELVQRIRRVGLEEVVSHRTVILPQLAAPGVSAFAVRRATGFTVHFGPVRAEDVPAFLDSGHVSAQGRTVTFTLGERAVLIPVELTLQARTLAAVLAMGAVLSGLTGAAELTEISAFWANVAQRFPSWLGFTLGGVFAGTVVVPLLLPWLPGRMFGLKGLLAGLAAGAAAGWLCPGAGSGWAMLGGTLWCAALASFLGTNFTGSTPFTSPSGVEAELRRWLPLQALGGVTGLLLWAWL